MFVGGTYVEIQRKGIRQEGGDIGQSSDMGRQRKREI